MTVKVVVSPAAARISRGVVRPANGLCFHGGIAGAAPYISYHGEFVRQEMPPNVIAHADALNCLIDELVGPWMGKARDLDLATTLRHSFLSVNP